MKFEENLSKLEKTVARMESGELSLDDMIRAFEDGRRLIEACTEDLKSIRQRIEKVTKDGVEELKI